MRYVILFSDRTDDSQNIYFRQKQRNYYNTYWIDIFTIARLQLSPDFKSASVNLS
jgi:hypothetical protein